MLYWFPIHQFRRGWITLQCCLFSLHFHTWNSNLLISAYGFHLETLTQKAWLGPISSVHYPWVTTGWSELASSWWNPIVDLFALRSKAESCFVDPSRSNSWIYDALCWICCYLPNALFTYFCAISYSILCEKITSGNTCSLYWRQQALFWILCSCLFHIRFLPSGCYWQQYVYLNYRLETSVLSFWFHILLSIIYWFIHLSLWQVLKQKNQVNVSSAMNSSGIHLFLTPSCWFRRLHNACGQPAMMNGQNKLLVRDNSPFSPFVDQNFTPPVVQSPSSSRKLKPQPQDAITEAKLEEILRYHDVKRLKTLLRGHNAAADDPIRSTLWFKIACTVHQDVARGISIYPDLVTRVFGEGEPNWNRRDRKLSWPWIVASVFMAPLWCFSLTSSLQTFLELCKLYLHRIFIERLQAAYHSLCRIDCEAYIPS